MSGYLDVLAQGILDRLGITSVMAWCNDVAALFTHPPNEDNHWLEPVDIIDRIDELVNDQIERGKADQL